MSQFPGVICSSQSMKAVLEKAAIISKTDVTVFLQGETGTGKDLLANWIQKNSKRIDKSYLTVNCGALPSSLLESSLFGHVRGSFTGAIKDTKGFFLEANNGTVFLDEITEMDYASQAKLLRVVQNHEIYQVGSSIPKRIDVRLIVASNRNLEKSIKDGKFRKDLYYRLNIFPIYIPPLRERLDDLEPLINHILQRLSSKKISSNALEKMYCYGWPGNIRELENVLEYASVISSDSCIHLEDLPQLISNLDKSNEDVSMISLEEMKKKHILNVLLASRWNKREAARILRINESTLYRNLIQYEKEDNKSYTKKSAKVSLSTIKEELLDKTKNKKDVVEIGDKG